MASYLQYRVKKLNGAHDLLPRYIQRTLDRVEELTGKTTAAERDKNEEILCKLIARQCEDTFFFFTTSSASKSSKAKAVHLEDSGKEFVISASAAIGNIKALESLLTAKPGDLWKTSYAFGFPLVAAASAGQLEVVKAIIHTLDCYGSSRKNSSYEQERAIAEAITRSLDSRNAELVEILARAYSTYCPVIRAEPFQDWLVSAVNSKNPRIVLDILQLKHHGGVEIYAEALQAACTAGALDIVRLFFDHDLLNLDQDTTLLGSPLRIAVATGNISVVKELLQLGARADGPRHSMDYPWNAPIWFAARGGKWRIVQMLVNCGAETTPITSYLEWKRGLTYNVIKKVEASLQKTIEEPVKIARPTPENPWRLGRFGGADGTIPLASPNPDSYRSHRWVGL